MSKNNLIRIKVENEGVPILDTKTERIEDLENIFDTIKKKLK